jgi:hypothetical protein
MPEPAQPPGDLGKRTGGRGTEAPDAKPSSEIDSPEVMVAVAPRSGQLELR